MNMKTEIEDKKLKAFLKSGQLESPGADFSTRVMNRVFEEKAALEQVKSEPLLGKGFWVILALFAGLMAVVFVLQGSGASGGETLNFLKEVDTSAVATGYQKFFEKLGALPLSVAGILLGTSVLLFLEKFLSNRSYVLS
jgi:ABC-type Fe3+ transport system permease subunit